jgi:threonine/homoserine/homoserine lactone efflux protein
LLGGKRAGFFAAWAHAAGISFWAFLTVAGLTVLIQTIPFLFTGIAVAGGAYLGWLGIQAFTQSSGVFDKVSQGTIGSSWKGATEGAMIAFLNPKTGLFFLALFSPFVQPDSKLTWQCVMVITPFLTDGLWFSFVTLVLARPQVLRVLTSHSRIVNRVSGTVLFVFSMAVFWHAISFVFSL